jgi:hypothetical protein
MTNVVLPSPADLKRAIARKAAFTANPTAHTFRGEIHDA